MAITEKPAEKTSVPAAPPRRWEPLELFDTLQDEMERLWRTTWPFRMRGLRPAPAPRLAAAWTPRIDVFEKDGDLVVKAELPGVQKDDIHVTLDRGDLIIQGERKEEKEVRDEDYYRCERSYGSFYRRLPLPADVKMEQIKASYTDGVLEVRVPKPATEAPRAVEIPIK